MKKLMSIITVILVAMAFGMFIGTEASAKEQTRLPDTFRIWTYGVGSASYYVCMGMAPTISKLTGMTIRVVPAGTDMARLSALRKGQGEMVEQSTASFWHASRGYLDYSKPDQWGPQKLRLVYGGFPGSHCVMTRADSGIKVMSDLKGKRFPYTPGNPAGNAFLRAFLAYGGLTWDDVRIVKLGSWSECMLSVVKGICDAVGTSTNSAACQETAAGPHGIYYIPMPPEDKEAWARLHKITPYEKPHLLTDGPGLSAENPHPGGSYPHPFAVYPDFPDHIAYAFAKAAYEGYDEYKSKQKNLFRVDHNCTIEKINGYSIPMHPASIKFFKEIGKWTDKAQMWQEERLLIEKTTHELWNKAPTAAEKAGIKVGGEGWPEFWRNFSEKELDKLDLKYAYK